MKVKYFNDTDTAHIEMLDREVFETREISENIYIDIDEKGNLVSITVEHAKESAGLWEFSYEEVQKKPLDSLYPDGNLPLSPLFPCPLPTLFTFLHSQHSALSFRPCDTRKKLPVHNQNTNKIITYYL